MDWIVESMDWIAYTFENIVSPVIKSQVVPVVM